MICAHICVKSNDLIRLAAKMSSHSQKEAVICAMNRMNHAYMSALCADMGLLCATMSA